MYQFYFIYFSLVVELWSFPQSRVYSIILSMQHLISNTYTCVKMQIFYKVILMFFIFCSQKAAFVWSSPPQASEVSSHGGGKTGGVVAGGTPPGGATPGSAQGLVHWMNVMAEHMNNPHTHDVHYMWNNVEVIIFLLIYDFYSHTPRKKNTFRTKFGVSSSRGAVWNWMEIWQVAK